MLLYRVSTIQFVKNIVGKDGGLSLSPDEHDSVNQLLMDHNKVFFCPLKLRRYLPPHSSEPTDYHVVGKMHLRPSKD